MRQFTVIALLAAVSAALVGCSEAGATSPVPPLNGTLVTSLSPDSAPVGSADLLLTVYGTGFSNETHNVSQIVWLLSSDNTVLQTTFVDSGTLAAIVPAALLESQVQAMVYVQTGDPMGDGPFAKTDAKPFRVTTPTPPGTFEIISISPQTAPVGSSDLAITITGSDLDLKHSGSHITSTFAVWSANGRQTNLTDTTVVSGSQITAVIPAALFAQPGVAQILIQKWYFQDDTPFAATNSLNFVVSNSSSSQSGFTPAGIMLFARSGHSATLLADGRVLFAGGDGTGATAEIYSPAAGSFTASGNMNYPCDGQRAVLLRDGRVLLAGGENSVSVIASAQIYDPATGSFTQIADMSSPRWGHTATLLPNGKVLIAGGADTHDSQASAELFDPATNSFVAIESMTSARMHHTATLLPNGRVLLAGGWSSYAPIYTLASAELFDPSTNSFAAVAGSMSSPRALHTATALPNGSVAILAGYESHLISITSDDILFPNSGAFVSMGGLQQDRYVHTATLLPDGRVLVVAGARRFYDEDGDPNIIVLSSAELFDPATSTSTFTGSLATARAGHTATLLNDGRVLVTGGSDANWNVLASAEIFK